MIQDRDIIEAFSSISTERNWTYLPSAYELRDFRWSEGAVDLEVAQRNGLSARLRLDLPSSGRLQPWLYRPPVDARDWLGQLFIWIEEEVETLGLGPSRTREYEDGQSYVVVEPYGWKINDITRHESLSSTAGPLGWHNDVRPD
jgi:hypothetical protein